MKTPIFLIIGHGSIGKRHFSNIKALYPDSLVIILHSNAKFALIEDKNTIQLTDLTKALSHSPTVAFICTPASVHLQHAKKLVEEGIPLLIEKPVASSFEEAKNFQHFLKSYPQAKILIAYNFRFSSTARLLKDYIQKDFFGKIYSCHIEMGYYLPYWRPQTPYQESVSSKKNLGGGVLLELSHAIDLMYWFFDTPQSVQAQVRKISDLDMDVNDFVHATFENFPNRGHLLTTLQIDMLQKSASRFIKLNTDHGVVLWDIVKNTLEIKDKYQIKSLSEVSEDWNHMYVEELNHFIRLSKGEDRSLVSFKDGLNVMKIIEAIGQASEQKAMI